jgi:hypothetical protein
MEPVSLILSALVAGAATTAGDVAQDAYNGLKALIKRKFESQGKAGAGYVLDKHEEKPEAWQEPLKGELVETGADRDEEILQAAQKLMELAKPQESPTSQYSVQVTGDVKGFVQHNAGTVTQNIN